MRKVIDNDKKFLAERSKEMVEYRRKAHKTIDEFEGSFAIVSLNFDKKDPTKSESSRIMICVAGQMTDALELALGLIEASDTVVQQLEEHLETEDIPKFLRTLLKTHKGE